MAEKGLITASVYRMVVSHHSHEIPVQLVLRHLLQQRLETSLEEHLEAQVILDDQGGLQTTIGYLVLS